MAETFPLVPFDSAHIPGALRLSRQVNWPHRTEDWAFTAAVSTGFVALSGNTVAGTAFCSDFGDFCTLNMIIVDAALRGHGLGRRLMDAVIGAARGRGMSLVATTDGLPLYRRLGFRATGEVVQHQGVVTHAAAPAQPFRIATKADLDMIAGMDREACGADRRALIANLLDAGVIRFCDAGFAALRDFGRGQVAGPVVARDPELARALIAACASPGRFLRVDTRPETGLPEYLTAIGLPAVDRVTAMHRGPARPAANEFMTFALVSQALG
jgi:GNAT superfamily N-acetyltransferase